MTNPDPLTPDQREALDVLVPPAQQTGNLVTDLSRAAREAFNRRVTNSRDGGHVITALHGEVQSWRDVERRTGIPVATARGWIKPPRRAGESPVTRDAPDMPASTPEAQPIVAAVVTSDRGMLVTWRNDATPPAGFLTGEIEPGESPEDAMIRECKEEAGLRVMAGAVIGRRVHPRTGRTMVYVTGAPINAGEIFVGDTEELAAVRWVSLDEAEAAFEPFGGMYAPVREYLADVIGDQG